MKFIQEVISGKHIADLTGANQVDSDLQLKISF